MHAVQIGGLAEMDGGTDDFTAPAYPASIYDGGKAAASSTDNPLANKQHGELEMHQMQPKNMPVDENRI